MSNNHCEGCDLELKIEEGVHVDSHGLPFMNCDKGLYESPKKEEPEDKTEGDEWKRNIFP